MPWEPLPTKILEPVGPHVLGFFYLININVKYFIY